MVSRKDANKARLKRHKRVRAKISGTAARPASVYIVLTLISERRSSTTLQA